MVRHLSALELRCLRFPQRPMRPINRLLLVLVTALVACGKQGDPKPPVPVIPRPTTDLVVTQRGAKMILSWSYPSLSTAGKSLGEIRRLNVCQ
jgi:hypothetical protein